MLVAALRDRLRGAALVDATTRGGEEVRLLWEAAAGERLLLRLLLITPTPLFWLDPGPRKKPLAGTGFGNWLRQQAQGAVIEEIGAGRSGRTLRLRLSGRPRALDFVLDPLPNACRFLVTGGGIIEQRYPPPIHPAKAGRGQPGQAYVEPRADYQEPWARRSATPWPDPEPDGDGLWVCPDGETSFLSPHPCDAGEGPHPPLEAARLAGGRAIIAFRRRAAHRAAVQTLRSEEKHLTRLRDRLRGEIVDARRSENLRRQGEALLAAAAQVPRGIEEVELDDPAAPGEKILIKLDPARSFGDNVARIFRAAGRLERALALRREKERQIALLLDRLGEWRHRLADRDTEAEDVLPAISAEAAADQVTSQLETGLRGRWERLIARLAQAAEQLRVPVEQIGYEARRGGRAPAEKTGAHPRRYELPDGWIALVGRSNQENDLLTHKIARPRDLWFHARGVAGSHVILQRGDHTDNPSKEILDLVAGIAAYHSKARTSRHAPVIYTEKRYVRKPRKAAPGVAVCLREKVLMAEPRLPEGTV